MVRLTSVIVAELHIEGVPVDEPEADAPLIIHCDGVLPLAISPKRMQAIAARRGEISQPRRDMERIELSLRSPNQIRWDTPWGVELEQAFGPLVGEAPDHWEV